MYSCSLSFCLSRLDRPVLFGCSLYESFLGNLVFNMVVMLNIVVALGYPFPKGDEGNIGVELLLLLLLLFPPCSTEQRLNKAISFYEGKRRVAEV